VSTFVGLQGLGSKLFTFVSNHLDSGLLAEDFF